MGRASHCTEQERFLVKKLREDGKTYKQIAKTLDRSENFVTNALKPVKKKETRGKPKKTSSTTDHRIMLIAKSDPFASSRTIAAHIGNVVSPRTVRRRLQDANLPGRIARKVPLLRNQNLRARMQFATEHRLWDGPEGSKKWRNILWSDETKINMFSSDAQRNVRRPPGKEFHPRYTQKTVKHGGGNIMVWGCFSWYGVGPIFRINTTMTRFEYKAILEDVMLPYAEENMPLIWHFQQDNDPKHTSKYVKEWFRQNNVSVIPWPSQSPDINPIENLWNVLKKKLSGQIFSNKERLWETVQKEWYATSAETCQRLVDSMPRRMNKMLLNKGGYTGY